MLLAARQQDDLFQWHFTIRGPGAEFEGEPPSTASRCRLVEAEREDLVSGTFRRVGLTLSTSIPRRRSLSWSYGSEWCPLILLCRATASLHGGVCVLSQLAALSAS